MDEDKDNQDIVVDKDGSMSQGVNIKVTDQDGTDSQPVVNDIEAPPEPTVDDSNSEVADALKVESTESESSIPVEEPTVDEVSVEKDSEGLATESEPIVTEAPISEGSSVSDPFSPATVAPTTPAATQSMSNNEQSQPKEHRNNKKLAIIVTILIAILLAGVAIFLFVSAEDNADEASTTNQSTQQVQEEVSPATAEDIDQAVTEIDETVQSIDDSVELNENAVSDTTLGL